MPDIRGLVTDPEFDTFSPEEKRDILTRAGARPEFIQELLENTAMPGKAPVPEAASEGRRMPGYSLEGLGNIATGALKGLGHTAVGAAQFLLPAGAAGALSPARAATTPTPEEQGGYNVEQFAEFFAPGLAVSKLPKVAAALSKLRAARPVVQGALEGGLVGSAQAGELDPGAAVGGAVGGGIGQVAGKAAQFAGRWLKGRAPQVYGPVPQPKGDVARADVNRAIEEALAEGTLPQGTLKTQAATAEAAAGKAGAAATAAREARAGKLFDIDALMEKVRTRLEPLKSRVPGEGLAGTIEAGAKRANTMEEGLRNVTTGKPMTGTVEDDFIDTLLGQHQRVGAAAVEHGPTLAQAQPFMAALQNIRKQFGQFVPAEVMERELALHFNPAAKAGKLATPETATRAAAAKPFQRETMRGLNELDEARRATNLKYNRAKALATALRTAATRETSRGGTRVGEAGAIKAGLQIAAGGALGGMVGGGPFGALAGAVAVPTIARAMESPVWRAFSAQKQYQIGRALLKTNPEVGRTLLGATIAGISSKDNEGIAAVDQIMAALQSGDKATARQLALDYKRRTGQRLDTRAFEAVLNDTSPLNMEETNEVE
jgi:hypothetical protein